MTATASASPTQPALATTATTALHPIDPDNAAQVVQLARLGRGTVIQATWSSDGKTLAVPAPMKMRANVPEG